MSRQDSNTQMLLIQAARLHPEHRHLLRAIPEEYFTPRWRKMRNQLLAGEPLDERQVKLLGKGELEAGVDVYALTVLNQGFADAMERWRGLVSEALASEDIDRLVELSYAIPKRPSLAPPLTVHERTPLELDGGNLYSYHFPESLAKVEKLLGRLFPGAIHCIGADNGVGKSLYLEQVALGLAEKGVPVVDFSVEMPFLHRLFRYLQHHRGIQLGPEAYFSGELSAQQIRELTKKLPQGLYVQTPNNINDVLQTAENLHHARGVNVFVLDFLQALQPLPGMQKYEAIAHNIEAIYHFTKRCPTTWLFASQYSRDGKRQQRTDREGRRGKPSNADLLGANEIETYSWTISHLLRDEETDERSLTVTKNRFGRHGDVALRLNPSTLLFECL